MDVAGHFPGFGMPVSQLMSSFVEATACLLHRAPSSFTLHHVHGHPPVMSIQSAGLDDVCLLKQKAGQAVFET